MNRLQYLLCDAVRSGMTGGKVLPPEAGRDLWNAFQRLSATRTYHAAGPNPIQPTQIRAWCQITGLPLAAHHVAILLAMDQAWLEGVYSKQAPEGVKTLARVSEHPINAALFDAVMG